MGRLTKFLFPGLTFFAAGCQTRARAQEQEMRGAESWCRATCLHQLCPGVSLSYLRALVCSSKRENCKLRDSSSQHLTVEFCNYPENMSHYIDYRHCSLEEASHSVGGENNVPVCEKFSVGNMNPCFLPGSVEKATRDQSRL